jgi:hypothetical protein
MQELCFALLFLRDELQCDANFIINSPNEPMRNLQLQQHAMVIDQSTSLILLCKKALQF